MKRNLLLILTLLLCASVISGQESEKIEYENLAIAKDGFSVDVPKDFRLMWFDKEEDKYRSYGYYSPELYLFIHSHKETDDAPNKSLISLANENKATASDLALKDFKATKYEFLDAEGFYQKIIIVPGKNRNLIFHSVSTTKDNPSVKKFFSSLKFDKADIPSVLALQFFNDEQKSFEKVPASKDESEKTVAKTQGSGAGSGSGSGTGSGQGSGAGLTGKPQSENQTAQGKTAGLKILSKPRPSYTDLARIYNMQGTVNLRVTFLASGEIGSVSAVKKLPFGLTLNSIKAAKLLQFEPAQRNGVPYSVTKTVQFSFTIY